MRVCHQYPTFPTLDTGNQTVTQIFPTLEVTLTR